MELYGIKPEKALEVGAANGYRLAKIHELLGTEVCGVEPSAMAVKEGKKNWPFIDFKRVTAAQMDFDHEFDLVIANFILHWVSRDSLILSIAKMDQALKPGGYMIIGDFQMPYPVKRRYHHIKDGGMFTYKTDYRNIFLSTGMYKEIAALTYDCDKKSLTGDVEAANFSSVSLLKKEESYIEIK